MSFNTLVKYSGSQHGVSLMVQPIGCVIDGCPPNITISEKEIQIDLDRRRPGQSKFTTQRKKLIK